jgi:hypothetical protein
VNPETFWNVSSHEEEEKLTTLMLVEDEMHERETLFAIANVLTISNRATLRG